MHAKSEFGRYFCLVLCSLIAAMGLTDNADVQLKHRARIYSHVIFTCIPKCREREKKKQALHKGGICSVQEVTHAYMG